MTPLYSQNGELIYPSDSEESLPATTTSTTDNRPATPNSHESLSSPAPTTKQSKMANSPTCAGRTENFSPRYSPPTIPNHLDSTPVTNSPHDTNTLPAVPSHMESLSAIPSTQPGMVSSQNHSMNSMNIVSSQANQLGMSMSHQIYKTSPQSSPASAAQHYDAMAAYSLPTNTSYQMNTQYPTHNIAQLTQNQSRC